MMKKYQNRFYDLRKEKSLSQSDIAKLLHTTLSTISAYINGKTLIFY